MPSGPVPSGSLKGSDYYLARLLQYGPLSAQLEKKPKREVIVHISTSNFGVLGAKNLTLDLALDALLTELRVKTNLAKQKAKTL